jgi:magnesium-transporting ATPase (P-type)
LLGDPLGAWLTLGILILNIVLNVAQQLMATQRLEKLMAQTRPQATAIRDGRIRSIEIDEIVTDDLLVIGPGDEFVASGEIMQGRPEVAEVNVVSGEGTGALKESGDLIQAGSHCIQGRAVYRVTKIPEDLGNQKWTPVQKKSELTPLQRIISRILRLMLVFIAVCLTPLLLAWFNSPLLSQAFATKYREAVSIIFSISASGLFFMIVASYALGSARLGGIGVLIRESQALESLAQVSTLCVSKSGALMSAQVRLEMSSPVSGFPILAESRIRQILGDLAHSATSSNFFLRSLTDNFSGSNRPLDQAAWFLSAYGWSAVTFSEADVPGTYVIGEPAILQPNLVVLQDQEEEEAVAGIETDSVKGGLRSRVSITHLGQFLRRNDQKNQKVADDSVAINDAIGSVDIKQVEPEQAESGSDDNNKDRAKERGGTLQGLRLRLNEFRGTSQDLEEEDMEDSEPVPTLPKLLFAYTPEPAALSDVEGQPQVPMDLIPLCTLTFEEKIQPQTVEAARMFIEAGVKIKILSSDDPSRMLGTAEQLGLTGETPARQPILSGLQLARMNESQFEHAVKEATILGQLNSEQKERIVRTLLQHEDRVAMVGDRVEDVPAMEAANLSIGSRSSSQAVLSTADIVLLEDSLDVLPAMLEQGQRIVNGLLDILKISLTQIGYILLLLLVMALTGKRSFFTVMIPSVGLTLWSSAQTLPVQFMRSRLAHFVVPAAITMAAATLAMNQISGPLDLNTPVSQLFVTYSLIVIGLLLVIFVQPPTRFWVGGDVLSGDRRIVTMVIVLFLLFIAITYIPQMQEWLRLGPLASARDYVVIAVVSATWTMLIRLIWRSPRLRERSKYFA